ncbi:helix-turn-helix transcriptional regulator [Salmonella enterica]|nr:XRE family transcriptional regulator [Salmonella enterica]EED8307023.1 helix-turn-helix transcriptional regulator [Salmonella enterica subsp. houtenae]EAX6893222.1 helix-turn-helix transcriptional regulator [Salmonella enterica]EBA5242911.1 helix-turn-helix transcriptional regulator [Salmonella enterica]EBK9275730.1 XRE family transcriptional regulator [Salmonella enterica]
MVPKRLKEAREAAGLSQEKLAQLVDVESVNSRSRISNYEAGRFAPPFDFVCRVADVLGYPEYYFYTVNDITAQILLQQYRDELPLQETIANEAQKMAEQLDDARKLVSQLTQCLKHRP